MASSSLPGTDASVDAPAPIHLLGTTLEGGGQLLRLAIGLSALTSLPIEISHIRGNRSGGGGLKWQHLTSVNWLGHASQAGIEGAEHKSKTVKFEPSRNNFNSPIWHNRRTLLNGTEVVDINISQSTPGAITLVFQAILPYILFSGRSTHPVRVAIDGGTNVSLSPSYEYVANVLLPNLRRIGIPEIKVTCEKRGWSTGRPDVGRLVFLVQPLEKGRTLGAFSVKERGGVKDVKAWVVAPKGWEASFRKEVRKRTVGLLDRVEGGVKTEPDVEFEDSRDEKRIYLLLTVECEGGWRLGRDVLFGGDSSRRDKRGKLDMEKVIGQMAEKAVSNLNEELRHGGCVDEHMRDQLVVFQALAKGKSEVDGGMKDGNLLKPSLHTQTAHWVANTLLGVQFEEDGSCYGVGFKAGSHLEKED